VVQKYRRGRDVVDSGILSMARRCLSVRSCLHPGKVQPACTKSSRELMIYSSIILLSYVHLQIVRSRLEQCFRIVSSRAQVQSASEAYAENSIGLGILFLVFGSTIAMKPDTASNSRCSFTSLGIPASSTRGSEYPKSASLAQSPRKA
jgi:hypothetical protein